MAANSFLMNFWPWNLRKKDPNYRETWGYSFFITPEHMSYEENEKLKQSCDTLADKAYSILAVLPEINPTHFPEYDFNKKDGIVEEKLKVLSEEESNTNDEKKKSKPKRDLYLLLEKNHLTDSTLSKIWTQANTVPDWVDWEQISRGQEVFYRYGGPALMGLAFQSLLGGMGAGRVVETLTRTGGFSTRVARHRLLETAQHILQCTKSLKSLQPGGDGWASSIRVRLLHAAVRTSIVKLAEQDPDYYDIQALGIPVNDLDCIATIVTFSSSLIWISFPRQGIFISQQESKDYIALWRYVAYLMGTPNEYFATTANARRAMQTLMLEIDPTETSRKLAHNIIEALALQPPNYPSRQFLEAFARWLNGNALCDALGLGRPSLYYWSLVAGQVILSMLTINVARLFKPIDRRKIAVLREVFWNIIVEGKEGLGGITVFDYKYLPRIGKLTKPSKGSKHVNAQRRTEARNLVVFMAASVTAVSIGWVMLRVLPSMVGSLRQSLLYMQYRLS